MNWEVFTRLSTLQVQIHWLAALATFVLGILIFIRKKGTRIHRFTGRIFVAFMIVTCVSAFFVRGCGNREAWSLLKGFSWIHLLIPFTIFMLVKALIAIRRGDLDGHKSGMIWTFVGGLLIAGAFTFLPGRHMHSFFFADPTEIQQAVESGKKH